MSRLFYSAALMPIGSARFHSLWSGLRQVAYSWHRELCPIHRSFIAMSGPRALVANVGAPLPRQVSVGEGVPFATATDPGGSRNGSTEMRS